MSSSAGASSKSLTGRGEEPMREVFHRIKNHLQMVVSMIELQAAAVHSVYAEDQLARTQRRVYAVALVWDALQRDPGKDRPAHEDSQLELGDCVVRLTEDLHGRLRPNMPAPAIRTEPSWLHVDRALPFLLIASELVANALEHGAAAGPSAAVAPVTVLLEVRGDHLQLQIGDRGPGFPPGFDPQQSSGFGLRLVRLLGEQISARFELVPGGCGGAQARLSLPLRAPERDGHS